MTPAWFGDRQRLARDASRGLEMAKKAFNQWLDAPDDREPFAVFVVGCQRSGTTMLIDTLMKAPDLWVHPEKSPLPYDNFRLRSPAVVQAVTSWTPAHAVLYKPLCDSHLIDRVLDLHPRSKAIWLVRRWGDVANSAVTKWGDHQLDVVRAIAQGRADTVGWRGERIADDLVEDLRQALPEDPTPHDGAALFWYLRNSFWRSLELSQDPRVLLVRYEDLVTRPAEAFPPIFAHLEVPFTADLLADVRATSVGRSPAPAVAPAVAARCDRLQALFDDAVEAARA
jgi:hypothetical protein